MARTPNSRKEETHERILQAASRTLRQHGYGGTGVVDVMKEVGLTHGGFYAHFASREALLAAAVERAGQDSADSLLRAEQRAVDNGASPLRALIENYLSDTLLAALDRGCPVAALGSEMPRQAQAVREASAQRVRRLIAAVQARLPEASKAAAPVVASAMVGALQLGRALGDNAEGRAVLSGAREALIAQYAANG